MIARRRANRISAAYEVYGVKAVRGKIILSCIAREKPTIEGPTGRMNYEKHGVSLGGRIGRAHAGRFISRGSGGSTPARSYSIRPPGGLDAAGNNGDGLL